MTSLVAVVAVASTAGLAFGRVFEGRPVTLRLIGAGVASAGLAWAFERRSLVLATLASGGVLLLGLSWLLFPETTWYGLPTAETLGAMLEASRAVGEQARIQVSPARATDPLLLASYAAVWAAAFSAHSLAFRAGSPLLALVPPAALVAFADSVLNDAGVSPLHGGMFLLAALVVVFADALRRFAGWGPMWNTSGRRSHLVPSAGRGARRIAVSAVALATLSPLIVPGFGSKAVIDLSSINRDDRIRLSPLVSMGAILTQGEPSEVFTVQAERPAYWRMTALERFDGVTWHLVEGTGRDVPAGVPLGSTGGSGRLAQEFTVANNLGFPWLPTAHQVSAVTSDAALQWYPSTQTVTASDPLAEGSVYTVTSSFWEPTAQQLGTVAFPASSAYPDLVRLPEDVPPQIQRIAEEWTDGAESTFDKVIAIQSRLQGFRYSTDVAFRDDAESLLEFLTVTQEGFCQQFASGMAVLLRSLDIPARVAIGFTAGVPVGNGGDTWRVTTDNYHSWVEVLFPGYGWLAFEPTPSRSNPIAASYLAPIPVGSCDPVTGNCANPGRGETGGPRAGVAGSPKQRLDARALGAGDFAGDVTGSPGIPLGAIGVAVALLAMGAAAVPLWRRGSRRRRIRRAGDDPRRLILATYDVFSQHAGDLGMARGPGETPQEYRSRLETSGRADGVDLRRLTGLTIRAAYSSEAPSWDDALDARADARSAIQLLTRATPLRRRVFGSYRLD